MFPGELQSLVFSPASDAKNQTDSKQEYAAENAEDTEQPYKEGGRIFVAFQHQRNEQDTHTDQEKWQGFVDWLRQSHDLIPSVA